MSALDDRISDLLALGYTRLKTASIPDDVAQELARRWLLAEARDYARKAVRKQEKDAARVAADARHQAWLDEQDRIEAAAQARGAEVERDWHAFMTWARSLDHISVPFFDRGTSRPMMWSPSSAPQSVLKKARAEWESGQIEVARQTLETGLRTDMDRDNERRERKHREWQIAVDKMIEERAETLEMTWVGPLLSSTVVLPDGSRVEWGLASINQHEERIAMLSKHAASELESAARHRAAVKAIRATPGAGCLRDVVARRVAA